MYEVDPLVDRFDKIHPHTSPEGDRQTWTEIANALYRAGKPFIGLSYDAPRVRVSDEELQHYEINRRVPW